jgi:AcrR family transcriptional regulator
MEARKKGKKKRISKPQEERRADLLDAAAAVFSKNGVHEAKIEDITWLAHVSKGTFYLYFDSKEDAAAAVWQRHIDKFTHLGESILNDETIPIGARLVKVFESLIRFAFSNAALHRSLYNVAGAGAVKAEANLRLIRLIGEAAQKGVSRGELHCNCVDIVVSSLFHGLCGTTVDMMRSKQPPKIELLVKTASRLVRTAFASDKTIL